VAARSARRQVAKRSVQPSIVKVQRPIAVGTNVPCQRSRSKSYVSGAYRHVDVAGPRTRCAREHVVTVAEDVGLDPARSPRMRFTGSGRRRRRGDVLDQKARRARVRRALRRDRLVLDSTSLPVAVMRTPGNSNSRGPTG
jgi:hypothetical protein